MQKSQLVSLINEIRLHYADEIDIVGSQSSYEVTMTPHDIVANSMEGDIIIPDEKIGEILKEACGRYSEYHARTKIHLDVLTTRAVKHYDY